VSSHPILPQARRLAFETAVEEALAEVQAAKDVSLLQECRAIFRKRVPLHLRAYVAAALALKGTAFTPASKGNAQQGAPKKTKSQKADAGAKEIEARRRPQPPVREAAPRDMQTPEKREQHEPRENRYREEGVTLFVSAGRRQRFYARVAIKSLLDIPGVTETNIGDIRTMDNYSFINVDPAVEEIIISAMHGLDFKGRVLAVNRARKKGDPAPETTLEEPSEQKESDPGIQEQ